MNKCGVQPGETKQKGGLQVGWPRNNCSRTPLSRDRERGKTRGGREGEAELLCNNNMVLKSKYQALATPAEIQRKKEGGGEEGLCRIGKRELRSTTESDPAVTSAIQQSSPASWSQG